MANVKVKFKDFIGDKAFYKMAFAIIIPVVIQQIILSTAGYVDNLMISSYSDTAYLGVSTANRFIFVMNFFWIGIASGISIFIAQYNGAKMKDKLREVIQFAMVLALIIGIISMALIYFVGPWVLRQFISGNTQNDLESIKAGTQYIQIIGLGAIIILINFVVSTMFRALGQPKVPMFAGIAGIVVNIGLNLVLIYGYLGFPEMGPTGAAIATVVSKVVDLGILVVISLFFTEDKYARKIWNKIYFDSTLAIMYFKKGVPIILNEMMWAIGVQLMALFITWGNTSWLQSYNYFQNITDLFSVYYAGLATGTAVLVGSALGANDFEKAKDISKKLIGLMFMTTIVAIVLVVSTSPLLLKLLTNDPIHYWNAYYLVLINSGLIVFYGFNSMVFYTLRAGGDSIKAFFLDQVPMYILGIPITILLAFMEPKWQIGLLGIFALTKVVDIIKMFIAIHFYRTETWLVNLTLTPTNKLEEAN